MNAIHKARNTARVGSLNGGVRIKAGRHCNVYVSP